MKIYKTKVIPAVPETTREVESHRACDICGKEQHPDGVWPEKYALRDGAFGVLDTEVSIEEGTNYPGDYDVSEIEYDICPTCFKEKLIPWIESHAIAESTEVPSTLADAPHENVLKELERRRSIDQ